MKRNKKNSDFFSKKRSKYKLTFFNESSLEDVWTICFSRFGAIMTAILLIGLIVVAILSVIVGTPVKNLLPGYLKTEERIEMVDKILRVDSLAAEVQRRDAYIKNLASILTGEIKIDSIGQQADSLLSTTTGIQTDGKLYQAIRTRRKIHAKCFYPDYSYRRKTVLPAAKRQNNQSL